MTPCSPLDRLAEAYQIDAGYADVWGRHHTVAEETKRALLAALGVPVGSDAEVKESLRTVAERALDRMVPAVVVSRAGERIDLPVSLPAGVRGTLSWSMLTEDGVTRRGEVSVEGLRATNRDSARVQRILPLMADLALGYHRCSVSLDDATHAETEVIIAPRRAYWPPGLDTGNGLAGVTAPLYGLRSRRNAGVGDFADLASLVETLAPLGATFVGINPVHALFPSQPARISPYAPSSRSFLNVMMIAPDRVPELELSPPARALLEGIEAVRKLGALRAAELVDYVHVSAFKLQVLEALFCAFRKLPADSPRRSDFQAFWAAGGLALQRHACFEALAEHLAGEDGRHTDWRRWPSSYGFPESRAVRDFADRHADRVMFYAYLQWLAEEQLQQAQRSAAAANMAIGLYLDLAVGVAPDGADAWSDRDVLVNAVRIGAPPDEFNPDGQNWGLLPLSPAALQARGYRPFIDLLRRTMRHAGAIRIDHALGLARSFWLPADRALPGAYVRYPVQDLLALVTLESHRQRCLVVGEDLGTVPEEFRAALSEHGLLGCRVLYFEREASGAFRPAPTYPRACVASIGTHDLPTVKGFWEARDIDWRQRLGIYHDAEQPASERLERRRAMTLALRLLAAEGLLPEGVDPEQPPRRLPWTLVVALHRFLARTPAALKIVQLEDALGAEEQANLPGTVDEYPNWRRKINVALEGLQDQQGIVALLRVFEELPTHGSTRRRPPPPARPR